MTVVVPSRTPSSACCPSCGHSNVRDFGGYFECATCGYGWADAHLIPLCTGVPLRCPYGSLTGR